MRTPGHDEELALGFLHGEGLIDGPREVGLTDDLANNTVVVGGPLVREPSARNFYTTSSCGVCGKGAIEEVQVDSQRLPRVERADVASSIWSRACPDRLIQPGFDRTGGLHATGLFDTRGELLCVREDVGRHNAMDKVIGWALREGLVPLQPADAVRQRTTFVRARAEGGGRRRTGADRRRGPDITRGGACA